MAIATCIQSGKGWAEESGLSEGQGEGFFLFSVGRRSGRTWGCPQGGR